MECPVNPPHWVERYWEVVGHRAINRQLEALNIILWGHIIAIKIFIRVVEAIIRD